MCAPLVAAESGETRNAIVAAIWSGVTQSAGSASGIDARLAGVSMIDGRIALVRMPSFAYSTSSASTRPSTARLAIA